MQRSSVVLPEPLGPITTTVSPTATDSDTPRSTVCVPKLFTTPDISSIARAALCGGSMADEGASFKVSSIQCQRVADAEIDRRRAKEDLERCQRSLDDLAACHRQFPK